MQSKNILLVIVVSVFMSLQLSAQESSQSSRSQGKSFDIEAFKKKKADFIIETVKLTDAEAKAFIPLTNELMDKRFELNRPIRKETREFRNKENASEAEYSRLLDATSAAKIKEAQLEQEYLQKFKKVLSAEKIYKYKLAEEEYMKKMVERRAQRNQTRGK